LLMLRDGPTPDVQYALRLWPAPSVLSDGTPLWIGTTQTLRLNQPFGAAALWLPQSDDGNAHAQVRHALTGFTMIQQAHPKNGVEVLRVRSQYRPPGEAPASPQPQGNSASN
ncbi:hypothetical protein AB4084_27965, partial [Lysobacter sp. 2RAB21]